MPFNIPVAGSQKLHVGFSFSFSSRHFKFFLETSSLIYGLFRSVFCSFQVFQSVPVSFLFLVSSLVPLWSENQLCASNSFKFVEVCCYGPESGLSWYHVSQGPEKNVHSSVVGRSIL